MQISNFKSNSGRGILRGAAWMVGARWAIRCIGLVSTVILARLLAPDDFGLIAMAMLAAGLLETIAYAGVDLALLRIDADTRDHFDTAWTVQLMQSAFIASALLVAAPVTAAYFSEPRAEAVVQLIALRSMIDGLQNIGIVKFRKELDFAKEFRFSLAHKFINFFVVVAAAYWFRNYWALIVGFISGSITAVVLSYAMHPYRPRLSLTKIGEIWSFSQWLMLARIGTFLNRKTDEFIVGGVAGTAVMGSYHLASDLATLPGNEVVMPMRRALFPSLAKLKNDSDEYARMVRDSFSAVSALCFSVGFGLMSVAPEVVQLVLGSKWVGAIPLIQVLSIYGAFSGLTLLLEVPLWVSGRTNLAALLSWMELVILAPLVWISAHQIGIEGVATARAAVAMVMMLIMLYVTGRTGSISFTQLCSAAWRPFCAALLMALVLYWLQLPTSIPVGFILATKVLLGAFLYSMILGFLWVIAGRPETFEKVVLNQVKLLVNKNTKI